MGAVLVVDDRVISTGYNGTPEGMINCSDGGCWRCFDRESFAPGAGYDVCICVHAEQNACWEPLGLESEQTAAISTQPCNPASAASKKPFSLM